MAVFAPNAFGPLAQILKPIVTVQLPNSRDKLVNPDDCDRNE